MLMDRVRQENLSRFGLRFGRGGVHLARSMMLEDLRQLFQHVPDAQATREDFARAILVDNCLGKRSSKTRQLSLRHLIGLYTLNPRVPIFRGLRFFWERDAEAQPLLACLVAFARDAVLRSSDWPAWCQAGWWCSFRAVTKTITTACWTATMAGTIWPRRLPPIEAEACPHEEP